MNVAKNSRIIAANNVQIATPNFACEPLLSLLPLTWFLMMPKRVKSVARTTTDKAQVKAETREARSAPQMPEPRARRKAMNARPQTMGWRTITRVRALVVSVWALLKVVLSALATSRAGL